MKTEPIFTLLTHLRCMRGWAFFLRVSPKKLAHTPGISYSGAIYQHMSSQKPSFLSHVAGLRGWAILLIVWFHITGTGSGVPTWASLPYGYFGVEVFIVIMGYFLISGFVRKGDVPLLPFIEGKFMRLMVPTAVLVLIVLAASLFVVDCDELRAMSKTGGAALHGTANLQLIRSTKSYFATDSSLNPFLHLWYLSVALQLFALGYAGYFILRRLPRKATISLLTLVAVVSYAFSMAGPVRLFLTEAGFPCPWKEDLISYYATLPRLWELLAGGAVLLLPEVTGRAKAATLSSLGFAMILVPACSHGNAVQALSLPVVLGTMLVIRYGAGGPIGLLLNNRTAQWIGGISTSVYLVHMPVLVLWKQWTFCRPTLTVSAILLVLSLLTAWGFYHAVEKRRFKRIPALLLWGIALAVALTVSSTQGLKKVWNTSINSIDPPEYPDYHVCQDTATRQGLDSSILVPERGWLTLSLAAHRHPKAPDMEQPLIQLGRQDCPARYVLIGDSHAQAAYMGLDKVSRELGISGVFLASIIEPFRNRECPLIYKGYFYNREKAAALMSWLEQHPELETVVIMQRWDKLMMRDTDWDLNPVPATLESNGPALRAFCEDLRAIGKKIVIFGPLPIFESEKIVTYARWLHRHGYPLHARHPEFICTRSAYDAMYADINALLTELERDKLCRVLHPAEEALFHRDDSIGEDVCRAVENGQIMYKDGNHISVSASLLQAEALKEQLRDLLTPEPNSRADTAGEQ